MRTFQEWAEQQTALFHEMAVLITGDAPKKWVVGKVIEMEGPGVYNILRDNPEGLVIGDLVDELIARSQFRKKGSNDEFQPIGAVVQSSGKSEAEVKAMLSNLLKAQIRKQKAKGWNKYIVVDGGKWMVKSDQEEPVATRAKAEKKGLSPEDLFAAEEE